MSHHRIDTYFDQNKTWNLVYVFMQAGCFQIYEYKSSMGGLSLLTYKPWKSHIDEVYLEHRMSRASACSVITSKATFHMNMQACLKKFMQERFFNQGNNYNYKNILIWISFINLLDFTRCTYVHAWGKYIANNR